jgi:hypothetical protein
MNFKMKNKTHINIFFALLLLAFFPACKKENRCDCFKGTGPIVTKTREVSGFDRIVAENNVNVFITQGPDFEVKIEAGDNLISLIKTEVTDGTLFIKNKNRCNWTRSYKKPLNVYVKMPSIKYITSHGTGKITSLNTITSDTFDIDVGNSGNVELTISNNKVLSHMFGSGDLILHGTTYEHDSSIGGTGYLYCSDLHTDYTWIESYTTGISYISATNLLICSIDQIGDIYCYSHPTTVNKTQIGKGHLYLP